MMVSVAMLGHDTLFSSILFPDPTWMLAAATAAADVLRDLNLDQVIDAIADLRKTYDLSDFFRSPLRDERPVSYRQEVMRDVEQPEIRSALDAFAGRMQLMRNHLAQAKDAYYSLERDRSFANALEQYCVAVHDLERGLQSPAVQSSGLQRFRAYLTRYASSAAFVRLTEDTSAVLRAMRAIRFNVLLEDTSVTVLPYAEESDYAASVEAAFEKFRRDAAKDYRSKLPESGRLNHVEAQILERVALLTPAPFQAMAALHAEHAGYLDATIARFDREIQFYVAYLTFIKPVRAAGVAFCYPDLTSAPGDIHARGACDLALAAKLAGSKDRPVANDVELRGAERMLVVSGPNHGGKTTFARMFGQLHYLAALGCPVPAASARLLVCDAIYTHFERRETVESTRGKLEDDLRRVRRVLDRATPASIVIMNEPFSSTTVHDALFLSRKVLAALSARDCLAVCVTFLDELAAFDDKTVSMLAEIDPRDPAVRTFKVDRRDADGLAYALAIAEKYRVTREWLARRIGP